MRGSAPSTRLGDPRLADDSRGLEAVKVDADCRSGQACPFGEVRSTADRTACDEASERAHGLGTVCSQERRWDRETDRFPLREAGWWHSFLRNYVEKNVIMAHCA